MNILSLLQGPVMVGSSQGGMNIEEVARENPAAIIKEPIDIYNGMSRSQAVSMAADMGFDSSCIDEVIFMSPFLIVMNKLLRKISSL